MNSLEFINKLIKDYEKSKERFLHNLKKYPNDEVFTKCVKTREQELQTLQQIKTELKLLNELKKLIDTGDIFSPSEFYNDYESCLKGDGSATFITKDLEIIEDFEKGWKLIRKEIDKYGIFSPHKCKIAFVVWFNR